MRLRSKLITRSQTLATRDEIRQSVPGIGPVNAASLVAWMPELGSIGPRQAASLLGVAPVARNSGRLSGSRHIAGGRRRPRNLEYMAAMTVCLHNADLQEWYQRLRHSGKPHQVALVAVMRKLIVLANTLLRENRYGRTER